MRDAMRLSPFNVWRASTSSRRGISGEIVCERPPVAMTWSFSPLSSSVFLMIESTSPA